MAGLFGGVRMPGPELMAQQAMPVVSSATPGLAMQQPRGIFGRAFGGLNSKLGGMDRNKWQMILAGVSDAGATLSGRQGNALQMARAMQQEQEGKQKRQEAFSAAYDPATGRLDPGKFITALGGDVPDSMLGALAKPEDPLLEQRQSLMEAQAEAARQQAASAQALAEQREALTPAQIAAYQALAGQRANQGAYYGARARQPYAPQRPRSGGGSSRPPASAPRGYDPSAVKWD